MCIEVIGLAVAAFPNLSLADAATQEPRVALKRLPIQFVTTKASEAGTKGASRL
jgi:hypothetical protein